MNDISNYTKEAISTLQQLIEIPSISREEKFTADLLENIFIEKGIHVYRKSNNIWALNKFFDSSKKTILLNSHHDTVKPSDTWTFDPFKPTLIDNKIIGLGSNDAGASLVCLMQTFFYFYELKEEFNLVFLASAEEEISGKNGVESVLPDLPKIDLGIVGEPTGLSMAIAEKGLMVIDAVANGKSGHAARNEGINAIHIALRDIELLKSYEFEKVSDLLGEVKVSITAIHAGQQHNVVPDKCEFLLDVRTNEYYSNKEIFDVLSHLVKSTLKARSFRLNSSGISSIHPLVLKGEKNGLSSYGSPTLSDQALMSFETIKLGPGESSRSHTADEFIYTNEIEEGIKTYTGLLNGFKF